jgi:hypothetical protein
VTGDTDEAKVHAGFSALANQSSLNYLTAMASPLLNTVIFFFLIALVTECRMRLAMPSWLCSEVRVRFRFLCWTVRRVSVTAGVRSPTAQDDAPSFH